MFRQYAMPLSDPTSLLLVFLAAMAPAVAVAGSPWPRNPPAERTSQGYAFALADTFADLDGDHQKERVTLAVYGHFSDGRIDRAALEVDLAGLVLRGDCFLQRVLITDIDTSDPWREIAVCDFGPSDDYVTRFFRYTRGTLTELGQVPGFPVFDGGVDGSGVIRTTCRGRVLQTWFHSCSYTVDRYTGAIRAREEYDFPMGTQVTLRRDLPVQAERWRPGTTDVAIAGVIPAGTMAVIERSDDRTSCFIRGANGVAGWFGIVGFDGVACLGLPAFEVFDGLSSAD